MRPISGRLRAASMNRCGLGAQVLRGVADAVLQLHGEAGARAQAGDGGGAECRHHGFRDLPSRRPR